MKLTDVPPEVLARVASKLDDRRDKFNLSWTCRAAYANRNDRAAQWFGPDVNFFVARRDNDLVDVLSALGRMNLTGTRTLSLGAGRAKTQFCMCYGCIGGGHCRPSVDMHPRPSGVGKCTRYTERLLEAALAACRWRVESLCLDTRGRFTRRAGDSVRRLADGLAELTLAVEHDADLRFLKDFHKMTTLRVVQRRQPTYVLEEFDKDDVLEQGSPILTSDPYVFHESEPPAVCSVALDEVPRSVTTLAVEVRVNRSWGGVCDVIRADNAIVSFTVACTREAAVAAARKMPSLRCMTYLGHGKNMTYRFGNDIGYGDLRVTVQWVHASPTRCTDPRAFLDETPGLEHLDVAPPPVTRSSYGRVVCPGNFAPYRDARRGLRKSSVVTYADVPVMQDSTQHGPLSLEGQDRALGRVPKVVVNYDAMYSYVSYDEDELFSHISEDDVFDL